VLAPLEQPLRLEVRVPGDEATDRVLAVAAQQVLTRVAPFGRVVAHDEVATIDAVVEAAPIALGVLADRRDPLVSRAARTSATVSGSPITEDDAGRWFEFDDDGQRRELAQLSGWALAGIALDCQRLSGTTAAGRALADVVRAGEAGHGLELINAALAWGAHEVDRVLSGLMARQPSRVRVWLAEQNAELSRVRAAHDALRSRYDRDLAAMMDRGRADG